jgi:hypothetical protein
MDMRGVAKTDLLGKPIERRTASLAKALLHDFDANTSNVLTWCKH